MRIASSHAVIALSALVATLPAAALDSYTGAAYARGTDTLLYRELHLEDAARHAILFQCPDGKAFARKELRTGSMATQPDFDFRDARNGYEEGVHGDGAKRTVYVRKVGGQRTEQVLTIAPGAIVDAGFDAFIRANWQQVVAGGTSVSFLMTGRGRVFPVKVTASDIHDGDRRVDLKLDAWYGFAAPGISVTYTEATKLLRRYEGPGTIRDAKGKPLDVRIEFKPADRKQDVPAASWDEALAAPLDGRCTA